MWFKNIKCFELLAPISYTPKTLESALQKLAFTPCLATLPLSAGWTSPIEETDAPLVYVVNDYIMICLQIEDKVLPITVVNQELKEKIKEIETIQLRKVLAKEKYIIKNGIYNNLLTKAFTKKSKIYAYFDTKNNWLIIDTVSTPKIDLFLNVLKKTIPNIKVVSPNLKKLSSIMTEWLLNNNYPNYLSIEKSCVLRDLTYIRRIIRCQQQDLSAHTIQSLLKDGYAVNQLALSWQDQIVFTLTEDFSLKSLKYQDDLFSLRKEAMVNKKQARFDTDFLIMTDILTRFLLDLAKIFFEKRKM